MLIRLVVLSLEGQDSYLRILVVAKGAIELSSSSGGNSSELNAGDNWMTFAECEIENNFMTVVAEVPMTRSLPFSS